MYCRSASKFQSRAGFSECLDQLLDAAKDTERRMFQSRAGFSECLDVIEDEVDRISHGSFNPVLGFLSVSTSC